MFYFDWIPLGQQKMIHVYGRASVAEAANFEKDVTKNFEKDVTINLVFGKSSKLFDMYFVHELKFVLF